MRLTVREENRLIRFGAAAVGYLVCLTAFYLNIGQDMGPGYLMPLVLPVIFSLLALQYATGRLLTSGEFLPDLITGLSWCVAFPLLYTWTYEKPWFMSKISYDFIIGTGLFVGLTALTGLLMESRFRRGAAFLLALLNLTVIAVPFVQFAYYTTVWHCLSPASLMALYLTNYRESLDYIESSFGILPALLIVLGLMLFVYWSYRCHLAYGQFRAREKSLWWQKGLLVILAAASFYVAVIWHLPLSSIAGLWHDVTDYVAKTAEYEKGQETRFNSLRLDGANTLSAKVPGTVILVIGESASRNYMHAFTPNFPYDNTPWLSEQVTTSRDFLLFHNVYAAWSQTVPVLQRALTEESQYNNKDFLDAVSIVDVAKKSGYETWWFSNQGRYGQFDSVITMIAKTAHHAEWTDDSFSYSDKYDAALLDYLPRVDAAKNNFIVLHLMGSHIYYNNRYPSTFERWRTADGTGMALSTPSYANTILYTDYILQEIYNYAKENLNLAAMIYFSDHGENLAISHNPDVFSFDMVRIPMFVYLSPEYQRAMPEQTYALRRHQESYFTNDMLYDTLCGILNAPSNRYEAGQDFSSRDYAFSRENLTTMLGQRKLTEDTTGE
ncbi:MAG: phosphoethanolamine transferase [Selenomonadaceae bacterium]|nr:phosphoethanolamine transferase [Selenomonadaceae bacterium]